MKIKLIATDLDGTLLKDNKVLSDRNKKALNRAVDAGIELVIATGRGLYTIPDHVMNFKGVSYFVTSNGANVIEARTGDLIFKHAISEEGIESVWNYLVLPDIMTELFYKSRPYVARHFWENVETYGTPPSFATYVRESRIPIDNYIEFLEEHKLELENINLVFANQERRLRTWGELMKNPLVNVTSSLGHNVEIGPLGVSKAEAIAEIAEFKGIDRSEIMCIGDNSNDLSMVEYAGIGVAMGNAVDEVKKAADIITSSNDNDGVAIAIEKYL